MQEEIEKMSNEELVENSYNPVVVFMKNPTLEQSKIFEQETIKYRKELLKRLKNNSVEEYKKKLIEEINSGENLAFYIPHQSKDEIINLINNLK